MSKDLNVSDVWGIVQKADLVNSDGSLKIPPGGNRAQVNAGINQTIADMADGSYHYSAGQSFDMFVDGINGQTMQGMAKNVQTLIHYDFGDQAVDGLDFLKTLQGSSIGKLDFNQVVQSGAAEKMIQLEKTNPAGFSKLIAGDYKDVPSLETALNTAVPAAAPAPATATAKAAPSAPASRPAV